MSDRILVVTAPDDTLLDGIRILHVALSPAQSQMVSTSMLDLAVAGTVINYVWNTTDPVAWLLDKKAKCHVILFNADAALDLVVGYMAAHANAYYFGTLRDLHLVNDRAIYSMDDITRILEVNTNNE